MSPAVSVVIPCFNGACWLPESIESVLSQKEVDLEIIVVDDGSDDDSCGLVRRYARADPRVRLIVQSRSGVSRARNIGTAHARGRFIQYLDVDDVFEPATIAARVDALCSSDSDIACCSWQWWEHGPADTFHGGATFSGRLGKDPELDIVMGWWSPPGALLFTREVLNGVLPWNEDLTIVQDWELLLRLASRQPRVIWLVQTGLHYRRHATATSLDGPAFLLESFSVIRNTHRRWISENSLTDDRHSTVTAMYTYFRSALGDLPEVVREIEQLSAILPPTTRCRPQV